jgi:hypothetical protein
VYDSDLKAQCSLKIPINRKGCNFEQLIFSLEVLTPFLLKQEENPWGAMIYAFPMDCISFRTHCIFI